MVEQSRVYRDSAGNLFDAAGAGSTGTSAGVGESGIAAALNQVLSDKRGTATLDLTKIGNTVEIAIDNGQGVLGVDITGLTGSGATVVATSTVGLIEFPLNMARVGAGGQLPMVAVEDSSWRSSVVAKTLIRIKVSVAGTGTANLAYALSTNASLIQMSAPLPPGNNRVGTVGVEGPLAVTGQFWPDVQAVSGTVSIAGTVPVSGKFWQDTQPISGAVGITGTVTVGTHAVTQSGAWNVSLAPSSAAASGIEPIRNTNAASLALKASAGNLYSAYAVAGNSGFILMALNRTAAPALNGPIAAADIINMAPVPANGYAAISPTDVPDRFPTGCVIIATTSMAAFTPPNPLPTFMRGKVA